MAAVGRLRAASILIAGLVVSASAALYGAGRTPPPRAPEAFAPSEPPPAIALVNWVLHAGDDARWASPAFDDSTWERVVLSGGGHFPAVFWLRKTVDVPGPAVPPSPLALSFYNLPSAFEAYWDGVLVAANGRVGASAGSEQPGAVRVTQILDRALAAPGRHVIALRVSNHHVRRATLVTSVVFGSVASVMDRRDLDQRLASLGLYFVAALVSAALFLRGRNRASLLLFGGFALLHLIHAAWVYATERSDLAVHVFSWIEPLVVAGIGLSFLLLTGFLLWHFGVPRRRVLVAVPVAAVPVVVGLGLPVVPSVLVLHVLLVTYATGLTVMLAVRRVRGSGLALAGTSVLWIYHLAILATAYGVLPAPLAGPLDLIPIGVSLSCLMGVIALRVRDETRALTALQSRSERLEAELLKKTIQPHFLMNTLLSIQSWFGDDPAKAGRLVEALADEFRIINRISAQPEIDMTEEIHLCRRHLELMGYRKDAVYRLEVTGPCEGIKVPPMLFHTLVENGLTHAYHARENGTFRLACARRERAVEFVIENDGSRLSELAAGSTREIEEGMGLKYVRSRLQESAPGCWELDYGVRDGRWRVRILMRKAGER